MSSINKIILTSLLVITILFNVNDSKLLICFSIIGWLITSIFLLNSSIFLFLSEIILINWLFISELFLILFNSFFKLIISSFVLCITSFSNLSFNLNIFPSTFFNFKANFFLSFIIIFSALILQLFSCLHLDCLQESSLLQILQLNFLTDSLFIYCLADWLTFNYHYCMIP